MLGTSLGHTLVFPFSPVYSTPIAATDNDFEDEKIERGIQADVADIVVPDVRVLHVDSSGMIKCCASDPNVVGTSYLKSVHAKDANGVRKLLLQNMVSGELYYRIRTGYQTCVWVKGSFKGQNEKCTMVVETELDVEQVVARVGEVRLRAKPRSIYSAHYMITLETRGKRWSQRKS